MDASLESLLLALESIGITPRLNREQLSTPYHLQLLASKHHSLQRSKQRRIGRGATWPRVQMSLRTRRGLLPVSPLEKRIVALRRLMMSGESTGIDGLLREAAGYIACLETKVKVMRSMVEVLEGPHE